MYPAESRPLAPELAARPSMELLSYVWRYVLGRMSLFVGLSGLLVISVIASYISSSVLLHAFGFGDSDNLSTFGWLMSSAVEALLFSLVAIPIWAGLTGIVFRLFDNHPEPTKGFSILQQRYGSVVGASLLASIPTLVIGFVCRVALPETVGWFLSFGMTLIVNAMFALAMPAVVRYDLKPLDALMYSARRFGSRPLGFLGFYLGTVLLALSGSLACGIGVLFTLGVLIVAPAVLMLEPKAAESEA